MMIGVVDIGLSNVCSVRNALRYLGCQYRSVNTPEEVFDVERLIFPGVGTFAAAAARLASRGLGEAIRSAVMEKGKPILGICLGMQLLLEQGSEGGLSNGLALIQGRVERLDCVRMGLRIPHIGWNDVATNDLRIFYSIADATCFYFVHSFAVHVTEQARVALCHYGVDFTAAVEKGHIIGTQFHPEKSQASGLRVLRNFLDMKF